MATDAICKNPECSKKFKRKNSKKVYCKLSCKNRGNYLISQEKNKLDDDWLKGYKNNKKIVEDLFKKGKLNVPLVFFEFMGFDFKCLKEKHYMNQGKTAYYRVGNYFLINLNDSILEIQEIKKQ